MTASDETDLIERLNAEAIEAAAEALRGMYHGDDADVAPFHAMATKAVRAYLDATGFTEEQDRDALGSWMGRARAAEDELAMWRAENEVLTENRDSFMAKYKEAADSLSRLRGELDAAREALKRLLLEFDFLIEAGHLPDIRNDMIFDEARAALTERTT